MRFDAALGEFRACQQQIDPSTCADFDNTAQQAFDQLQIWLNQDHYNRIDINLRLSSEMMWYYGDPTP